MILISIHARAEPMMNVRSTFTGMNHLHINQKLPMNKNGVVVGGGGGGTEFQKFDRAKLTRLPNFLK